MYTYRMREKRSTEDFPFFFDHNLLQSSGFHEHTHDFRELVIMTGGTGLHSADGRTFPVSTGDVFVMNAGETHGFGECRNLEVFSIGFDNSILHPLDFDDLPSLKALLVTEPALRAGGELTGRLHLPPGRIAVVRRLLQGIVEEWTAGQPGYLGVVRNLFENLMIQLARYFGSESNPPGHTLTRLTECMNVLETEFGNRLDIRVVAEDHGFRYTAFRDEVKKVYGTTPLQYLIGQRLSRAADLLTESDERISEIGYQCGFDDSNYFSRMFRKETGMSPREYRRQHRHIPAATSPGIHYRA